MDTFQFEHAGNGYMWRYVEKYSLVFMEMDINGTKVLIEDPSCCTLLSWLFVYLSTCCWVTAGCSPWVHGV